MIKIRKSIFACGLLTAWSGVIITDTGWDYKYDLPVEKWVGWVFVLYGIYIVYASISKK